MEFEVDCPHCGRFVQVQKSDPVLCPKCQSPEIDTIYIMTKEEAAALSDTASKPRPKIEPKSLPIRKRPMS